MDTKTILNDASGRMQKAIDHLEEELLNVRAGKASPNALNGVMVDYFGSQVPVSGAASVTVPDAKTILIQPLLPAPGVLTKRRPTEEEWEDMKFGCRMAKELGRLDVGQTVVVKKRAVMALEAIEGTDACILRGGFLGRGGVIVAKTAKPAQDNRFDMPSVGTKTLDSMIHAGATGLVIEAGHTLLVDRQRTLALADEKNMTIVAVSETELA